jgi:hypothetical protein
MILTDFLAEVGQNVGQPSITSPKEKPKTAQNGRARLELMVGGTGLEPVTPCV